MKRLGSLLVAVGLLGWLASRHPGVRFVDFISFGGRASGLATGQPVVDGLYPHGYPALLAAGQLLTGDLLIFGKALSVLAGAVLVVAVATRLGLVAGAYLLAQVPLLLWGSTEGSDMLAAALALAGLLSRSSPVAGACVGLALATRWTAAAWVLPALWLAESRPRFLAGLALGFAPHLVLSAVLGGGWLPDQGLNVAIAGGGSLLARLPGGLRLAASALGADPFAVVGGIALVLALRQPLGRALALGALLHAVGLAAVFANPRLALPATLALILGPPVLLASWKHGRATTALLALAAAGLATFTSRQADDEADRAARVAALVTAVEGELCSNTPWAYARRDGWVLPARQLSSLGPPHLLLPAGVAEHCPSVLFDAARGRGFPGLRPMLGGEAVSGWTLRARDGALALWTTTAPPSR
ncbi:MAG: hypothetical protein FJ090_20725 [Deltaproteobacteria bacterium]|nr:hypothetical protein [Deltaproteobacteria bacterium]